MPVRAKQPAGVREPEVSPRDAKPFLKWVGGKRQLLDRLVPMLPPRMGRYFEPFVGGGALFFHLAPERASLTDVNAELVNCYVAIRDHVDDVLAALSRHHHDEEHFYEVRARHPDGLPPVERAARTIFLNKTGFNGLYRVNSKGLFNVPFGRYAKPNFLDEKNLRACSRALARAELEVRDFAAVLDRAKKGDFVYFDPPYVPVSSTGYFTAYAPGGFGWEEQKRLADVFAELARRGVFVMLSNSHVPELEKLYARFRIDVVAATRMINSKAAARGEVGEIVVRGW